MPPQRMLAGRIGGVEALPLRARGDAAPCRTCRQIEHRAVEIRFDLPGSRRAAAGAGFDGDQRGERACERIDRSVDRARRSAKGAAVFEHVVPLVLVPAAGQRGVPLAEIGIQGGRERSLRGVGGAVQRTRRIIEREIDRRRERRVRIAGGNEESPCRQAAEIAAFQPAQPAVEGKREPRCENLVPAQRHLVRARGSAQSAVEVLLAGIGGIGSGDDVRQGRIAVSRRQRHDRDRVAEQRAQRRVDFAAANRNDVADGGVRNRFGSRHEVSLEFEQVARIRGAEGQVHPVLLVNVSEQRLAAHIVPAAFGGSLVAGGEGRALHRGPEHDVIGTLAGRAADALRRAARKRLDALDGFDRQVGDVVAVGYRLAVDQHGRLIVSVLGADLIEHLAGGACPVGSNVVFIVGLFDRNVLQRGDDRAVADDDDLVAIGLPRLVGGLFRGGRRRRLWRLRFLRIGCMAHVRGDCRERARCRPSAPRPHPSLTRHPHDPRPFRQETSPAEPARLLQSSDNQQAYTAGGTEMYVPLLVCEPLPHGATLK